MSKIRIYLKKVLMSMKAQLRIKTRRLDFIKKRQMLLYRNQVFGKRERRKVKYIAKVMCIDKKYNMLKGLTKNYKMQSDMSRH
jgi:hypothetical protein